MSTLSPAIAIAVSVLVVLGSTTALLGALGLIRLKSFYERLHAASLVTSGAVAAIVLASILYYSSLEGHPVLRDLIVLVFVVLTTPVVTILVSRAALQRDRTDGRISDPQVPTPKDPEGPQPS